MADPTARCSREPTASGHSTAQAPCVHATGRERAAESATRAGRSGVVGGPGELRTDVHVAGRHHPAVRAVGRDRETGENTRLARAPHQAVSEHLLSSAVLQQPAPHPAEPTARRP